MAEPGVLVGLYDLVLWYTQRTERFPKSLRITLGDRIRCFGISDMHKAKDEIQVNTKRRTWDDAQSKSRNKWHWGWGA